jgi:hypothetical protein
LPLVPNEHGGMPRTVPDQRCEGQSPCREFKAPMALSRRIAAAFAVAAPSLAATCKARVEHVE